MDENTEVMEQTADQQDSFLAGWDEDDVKVEAVDQPEETESAPEAAEKEEAGIAEAVPAENPTDIPKQPEAQSWVVKHMGEERKMAASDITPELLQKGLDYDRVRGKYDEAKPVMEMFTEFAKSAGMTVTDYAKYIRAEAKKASGMSEAEAKRAVELEDREAAVNAAEAAQNESKNAKVVRDARIKDDLANFQAAFPEIYNQAKGDPKTIPQSVWNDVSSGKMTLTAAYSKYAVAQAQELARSATEAAKTSENNQRNASRSTGSMKSAGNDAKNRDAFAAAFDEG